MSEWHRLGPEEAVERLRSSVDGLGADEAARRLAEHGRNELLETKAKSAWHILVEQFTSLLILILIVAAVVSAVLGDVADAVAIMAIVILNGALGFRQEYRAERTMIALRQMAAPIVRVRREARVHEIPGAELVPGDLILVEAGNVIPADARLLESAGLRVQEATLTGESEPVEKSVGRLLDQDVALADRLNMLFMGTAASYGRGTALVTATGMDTELGKIAEMVQRAEETKTPLQKRLAQLGRWLAVAALVLVVIIFITGITRGEAVRLMFLTAVSMAVAAVPEGLPAIVTVALSLGAQRMLRRKALIRKLPAVEALGSVTVICSDKTGTLTENRMTVVILDSAGHRVDLEEETRRGRSGPLPRSAAGQQARLLDDKPAIAVLVAGAVLCNDSIMQSLDRPETSDSAQGLRRPFPVGGFRALGDPTEAALVTAGVRLGLLKTELVAAFPRTGEIPFDSDRRRMTTVHTRPARPVPRLESLAAYLAEEQADQVVFTKGAPEALLSLATMYWDGKRALLFDPATRQNMEERNRALAAEGMRVLAVAFRGLGHEGLTGQEPNGDDENGTAAPATGKEAGWEKDLVLAGLVGMIDPARTEAREAVLAAIAAGIRAVMITGDQPLTARTIARQIGMVEEQAAVLTGGQLAALSPEQLAEEVERTRIYARVAPEQKLTIVQALQEGGHIVAMTGDGVNDAPALQKADIGVAMGVTGTDVAKEAADMVLLDDNFATIVAAVREGRAVFDNIRKFIKYLMATNVGELTVMLFAPVAGMPLPLLPLQILWMNLVTDGLPGLALGFEAAEPNVMQRRPNPSRESIFARGLGSHILWAGPLMGVVALLTGWVYWRAGDEAWQTMLFTVLTISQMAHVLAIHQERRSVFGRGIATNPLLLGAVFLTFLLQFALLYVPFLQGVFGTRALDVSHVLIAFALSTVVLWVIEVQKIVWKVRG